jgi:hypothetical protein
VAELKLRNFAINGDDNELIQQGTFGDIFGSIEDDILLGNIQLLTGLNLDMETRANNYIVEIEDPVLSRKLGFQYWVQEI